MKAYKSYIDNITIEPELQDKIINNVKQLSDENISGENEMQKTTARKRNANAKRFIGVAACAVLVLLGALLIPGIISEVQAPGSNNIAERGNLVNGEIPANGTHELYALIFNSAEEKMAGSRMIRDGYFGWEKTKEQLAVVFPNLSEILSTNESEDKHISAFANYRPDGSLEFAGIQESVIDNEGQVFWMNVQVAYDYIPDDMMLFYCGETTVSYVHGIPVTAFVHVSMWDDVFLRADFLIDNIAYRVTLSGYNLEEGKERITKIVNLLIVTGPADLSVLHNPIIPEMVNEQLTLDEARQDIDFGMFVPINVPENFEFSSAIRVKDNFTNNLMLFFNHDVPWSFSHTLTWLISTPSEDDLQRLVSVYDLYKFDVSLYPIPWFETVPHEIADYFFNPVFLASELTIETVQARTRLEDGRADVYPEWRTDQFGVLFDNVLVNISASGLPAEQVWEMIRQFNRM